MIPGTQEAIRDEIFHLAVKKCRLRLGYYANEIKSTQRNCRMQPRKEVPDDTGTVQESPRFRKSYWPLK
jgi:hypothetical protein